MSGTFIKRLIGFVLCLFILAAIFLTGCAKQLEEIISGSGYTQTVRADNDLLTDASVLTKLMVGCVIPDSTMESPEFHYMKFLTSCASAKITEENFCYYGIFPLLENSYAIQFPADVCNKVIRQVFGDYSWDAVTDFGTPPNGGYNEETQRYEFSIDFGWGFGFYSTGGFISNTFSADRTQVISNFELMVPDTSSGDPGQKSAGMYNAIYDIVSENDEQFLRFVKFEKI